MLDLTNPKHAHVDQRLRAEPIIWLSTTRPDGRPHLVPVWFWWDGATVLIFTPPTAQKIRNLRHSPSVTLALNAADDGEDVVLFEGTAELTTAPSSELMPPEFGEKYAALFKRLGTTPRGMKRRYSQPIRITPTRLLVP